MLSRRFFKLFRVRLALLLCLIGLPAVVLIIRANLEERRSEKARVRESALASTRLAASSQADFIKNTRQLLSTLTPLSFLALSTNRVLCETAFSNLRRLAPDYSNFGIIETNGTVFCSADHTNRSASVEGRYFFGRVMRTRAFAVGGYIIGKVTGHRMISFGYPIFNPERNLVRVMSATVDLTVLARSLAEARTPEGGAMVLLDRNGTVLAAQGEGAPQPGERMGSDRVLQRLMRGKEAAFDMTGADGVQRLYAVTPVSDGVSPAMFVYVGIPLTVSMAHVEAVLVRNLSIFGAVAILVWAALWVLSRRLFLDPVKSLSTAASRVAGGDFAARCNLSTGPVELIELGRAFDDMAERLEQRGLELKRFHSHLESRVAERTAELESANKELEAFTYSVSHDLRSPLRHIRGFAEILAAEHERSLHPEATRLLTAIRGATNRMTALIEDLLLFSKMGRDEINRDEVDLDSLVQEAKEMLPELEGRRVEWVQRSLGRALGDRSLLRQVFFNLISNALKYTRTRDPAVIEIGSRLEGDHLIISIRDNGVGFNPAYSHKLFGVFERLHHQNEFEGTGIGLANVRRIIARHGGRTWAEGAPGEGAIFYFSLPAAQTQARKL
ncbi:MAG TPA: ATP-binding protein [Verrucomicrobiae bacterium]|nr:ATP-binding protein [Verrucomicrobiae bacterium]